LPSIDALVAGNTADALDRLARLVSHDEITRLGHSPYPS
jgi:hypothetical protein